MKWNENQKTNMLLLLESLEGLRHQKANERLQKGMVGSGGVRKKAMSMQEVPIDSRMDSLFSKLEHNGDCIDWVGFRNKEGRGAVYLRYKFILAPRLFWILSNGPIQAGMCVLHRCDRPQCVNVEHLFIGTQADNVMDCVSKGRASGGGLRGERSPVSKLTEAEVVEIRKFTPSKRGDLSALARRFGVSSGCITQVRSGKHWKHI